MGRRLHHNLGHDVFPDPAPKLVRHRRAGDLDGVRVSKRRRGRRRVPEGVLRSLRAPTKRRALLRRQHVVQDERVEGGREGALRRPGSVVRPGRQARVQSATVLFRGLNLLHGANRIGVHVHEVVRRRPGGRRHRRRHRSRAQPKVPSHDPPTKSSRRHRRECAEISSRPRRFGRGARVSGRALVSSRARLARAPHSTRVSRIITRGSRWRARRASSRARARG